MNSLPVVLTGLPGAVTNNLARAVAAKLGRSLVDTDPDSVLSSDKAEPTVRVAGPETVATSDGRQMLAQSAITVWVDGDDDLLAQRSRTSIGSLQSARRMHLGSLTSAADSIVDLQDVETNVAADAVVDAVDVASNLSRHRVVTETVSFADGRSYPIHVGRGVVDRLADVIPERAQRVAVITQESIGLDVDTGREQKVFMVEDGERAKRLDVVGQLASALAQWEMTRADVIVSVGGGVVSDLAGFLAASYHRGLPVVHVSTTLLGQIDAAIGGKCGVNLPEGKNLVGAFWQPTAVLCEIDALSTLPAREFLSGMGELAKYHFLGGGELDRLPLVERVAESARIKADVVSGDEREGGRRAVLNYGHTLAHALETAGRYDLRHGEAVAIGLLYAAELAHRLGRIDHARVQEHRRVVARYGLDGQLPSHFDQAELVQLFQRDKKAVGGTTFVLDGPNGVESVRIDDKDLLSDVFGAIAAG